MAGRGWKIIDDIVKKQEMKNLPAPEFVLNLMTCDCRRSASGFPSMSNLVFSTLICATALANANSINLVTMLSMIKIKKLAKLNIT